MLNKIKIWKLLTVFVVTISIFSLVSPVLAQTPAPAPTGPPPGSITITPARVPQIITKFAVWLYRVIFALSVVFLLLAAFYYTTASPNNIKKANNHLIYGIGGIALAIISFSISKIVAWFF